MGDDDYKEKKAVYLGMTLEWSEDGPGCSTRSETCAITVARVGFGNVSECVPHATKSHSGKGRRSEIHRPEVSAELATKHRAAVAWVVYLAQDRLDLGVAAVELAHTMAIPREG